MMSLSAILLQEKLVTVAGVVLYGAVVFILPIVVYLHFRPTPQQMAFFFLFYVLMALEMIGFFGTVSLLKWFVGFNHAFDEFCYTIWNSLRRRIRGPIEDLDVPMG